MEQERWKVVQPPIYALLGFMGSGKSTLGPLAANLLGRPFMDLDEEIVASEGMSITQTFASKGESYFRALESRTMKHLVEKCAPGTILATGGGTPCYFDNLDFLRSKAVTVFLDVTPEALFHRLLPSKDQRPLLRHLDKPSFRAWVHTKLTERRPWYQLAHGCLRSDHLQPEDLVAYFLLQEKEILR